MSSKTTSALRLNIYINDPDTRRQVKTASAKQDISISEYCLRAITAQLIKNGERPRERKPHLLKAAIERAKRFQTEAFGKQVFSVSSADLIREARKDRNTV
ncbi:MAG: hypothetical protein QMC83_09815 [Thermodesulfovibrionales bacterium]|nr:hypothetical protein [Thermodesulfovibrionales bacterium]